MPPRQNTAARQWPACLLCTTLLAATLILPAAARAADPGIDLSPAHDLSPSLDLSAAPFSPNAPAADVSAGTGFNQADIDPALARPGDILQSGVASYYSSHFCGRRTASGARYNPEAMTAASHTLPLGTRVLVTLEGTARSVLVTITDHQGTAQRIIDLSKAAARKLGLLGRGTGRVVLTRA